MKLTKKAEGKRQMKKIDLWWSINKSTPEQWFDRWENFLTSLFKELGFSISLNHPIQKVRGKEWEKNLGFSHSHLGYFRVAMKRTRRCEKGGYFEICKVVKDDFEISAEIVIQTTFNNSGPLSMCRTTVGNEIITFIRNSWKANASTHQKSAR